MEQKSHETLHFLLYEGTHQPWLSAVSSFGLVQPRSQEKPKIEMDTTLRNEIFFEKRILLKDLKETCKPNYESILEVL